MDRQTNILFDKVQIFLEMNWKFEQNKSIKNIPKISYLDMIYDSNYSPNSDLGNSTGIRWTFFVEHQK